MQVADPTRGLRCELALLHEIGQQFGHVIAGAALHHGVETLDDAIEPGADGGLGDAVRFGEGFE